jgi:hypothetical protein
MAGRAGRHRPLVISRRRTNVAPSRVFATRPARERVVLCHRDLPRNTNRSSIGMNGLGKCLDNLDQ